MSSSIKELYQYDLVKKCCRCKTISLKEINFHKDKNRKDGYKPDCKTCRSNNRKDYYCLNREKEREYYKKYREDNKEKKK